MASEDAIQIGKVLDAMYELVSGPAGPRDWSQQLDIFHPDCRQIRTGCNEEGDVWYKMFDPETYRADADILFRRQSFYEVETTRKIQVFGNMAHAWSAYEAKLKPDDEVPERRGINSIQLFRDGPMGWRVMSMIWDNEREDLPLENGFAVFDGK